MAECGDIAEYFAAVQTRCFVAGPGQVSVQDHAALLAEVRALANCIECTRSQISALDCNDMLARQVPAASDELDAIVTHTAAATSTILDQCERLERELSGTPGESVVGAATSRIYEACSFQDITGQRVAKVVLTLQQVEARVAGILRVFGESGRTAGTVAPAPLLNGPQPPHAAMDQIAVDALLASFD